MNNRPIINIAQIVGQGYKDYWNCKQPYRVCKGSRASKKSKTTALWYIYHLMKYPLSNLLVVRAIDKTNKDSTYSDLQWAINMLGVNHLWKCTKSPLEITYTPTGQKILFRGLNNPMSITSISVPVGVLCFCWCEECFQIKNEEDFDMIDMSIRGELPNGYFKQITLTFNPWSDKHWLKRRFFDLSDEDKQRVGVFTKTTNYTCNEHLSETDLKLFENMKIDNPRAYQIAGLGNWGISEGLLYDHFTTYGNGVGKTGSCKYPVPPKFNKVHCQVDFKTKGKDYYTAIVYGVYQNLPYVIDIYYSQDVSDISTPKVVDMCIKHKATQVKIEGNGAGYEIAKEYRRLFNEQKYYGVEVKDFHNSTNKEAKINANMTFVMNSLLFPDNWETKFRRFSDDMYNFLAEFKDNNWDDAPDCCSEIALNFVKSNIAYIPKSNIFN